VVPTWHGNALGEDDLANATSAMTQVHELRQRHCSWAVRAAIATALPVEA
jgi:hypothetical protein